MSPQNDYDRAQEEYDTYLRLVEGTTPTKDIVVETREGDLNFTINQLELRVLFNHLSKVDDDFMSGGTDRDDLEEMGLIDEEGTVDHEALQERTDVENDGTIPDGETIDAFQSLIIDSLSHAEITQDELVPLVRNHFSLSTITELGLEVIFFSMDMSDVTGFRTE